MHTRRFFSAVLLSVLSACTSQHASSPYETPSEARREPQRAQKLSLEAADLMKSDPESAEAILKEALAADLYHGPAHNNLGVLYLAQSKLYEAANEFEWARKLMPGHPDPRLNLGLTLERAGRIDEAIDSYDAALEVYPEHLPTMEALARLIVRSGRSDDRLPHLIHEVSLRGETEQWRNWAREQAVLMK